MILCRFSDAYSEQYGIVQNHKIQPISGDPFGAWESGIVEDGPAHEFTDVRLLCPVVPSKIIGVGLNYRKHAEELKLAIPQTPVLFMKPPTSVIGSQETIICPKMSAQVDYEAELAIVIGKPAKNISVDQSAAHIFGYTCMNDVTARDLQKLDGQWTRAKSFDTFSAIGPWIVTDFDPSNVQIECYLNGELRQNANTSDMIFSVPQIVSFVSQIMTLNPGDVITTGTPPGIGPIKKGDTVDVRIDGIGILRNFVTES